jgi:hypothetical protein
VPTLTNKNNTLMKFNSYRYFIVPFEEQVSLEQMLINDKREILINLMNILEGTKKIDRLYRNKRYILYLTNKLSDGLYVCKFAKEKNITIYEEGNHDIEDQPESSFPYIFLIVDLHRQIILIQEKSSVFPRISTSKNAVEGWFSSFTEDFDYVLSLDEISYEQDFWNYVQQNEGIYELELTMKSPNLFGGLYEAEELLKQINNEYNNTETTIKVKNDKGKLRIIRDRIQSFIKYISGGGGKWSLEFSRPNHISKTTRVKSTESIRTVMLESDSLSNKKVIIQEINKIDEIITEVKYNSGGDYNSDDEF